MCEYKYIIIKIKDLPLIIDGIFIGRDSLKNNKCRNKLMCQIDSKVSNNKIKLMKWRNHKANPFILVKLK